LALTPADVRRIAASGRKVAVIGVENGYPIGRDLNRVREFWQRGARYMSLAHNGHSQLSDSNTGEANKQWAHGNGLSELGKQVIAEMNRWGIMVDVSHPSKGSMMQAAALSQAPIIASHSGARALCDNSRNMDDEMLQALKKSGRRDSGGGVRELRQVRASAAGARRRNQRTAQGIRPAGTAGCGWRPRRRWWRRRARRGWRARRRSAGSRRATGTGHDRHRGRCRSGGWALADEAGAAAVAAAAPMRRYSRCRRIDARSSTPVWPRSTRGTRRRRARPSRTSSTTSTTSSS
jgi:hypothetical protein